MSKNNHVAFIPARGGSKRLPHKNKAAIRPGISLTAWSVIQAIRSKLFSQVVVSTDDAETWCRVVQALKNLGFVKHRGAKAGSVYSEYMVNGDDTRVSRHRRPDTLATSKANVWEAVDHWLNARTLAADAPELRMLVMMQPTNPFRTFDTLHKVMLECTKHKPEVFTAHVPKFLVDSCGASSQHDWLIPNGNLYASLLKTVSGRLERVALSYGAGRASVVTKNVFEQIDIDTGDELLLAKAIAECENIYAPPYQLIRGDHNLD